MPADEGKRWQYTRSRPCRSCHWLRSGWLAELSTWRWVFRSTTISCGIIQLFGLYYLDESRSFPAFLSPLCSSSWYHSVRVGVAEAQGTCDKDGTRIGSGEGRAKDSADHISDTKRRRGVCYDFSTFAHYLLTSPRVERVSRTLASPPLFAQEPIVQLFGLYLACYTASSTVSFMFTGMPYVDVLTQA